MKRTLLVSSLIVLMSASTIVAQSIEYVPGEILIKFNPGIVDIKGGLDEGTRGDATINSTNLDSLLTVFSISRIERIFKGSKNQPVTSRNPAGEITVVPDVSDVFKLSLPPESDIIFLCSLLVNLPEVEYATPNPIWRLDSDPDDPYYTSQWHLKDDASYNEDIRANEA